MNETIQCYNVEALKLHLLQSRTTKVRFKLPLSEKEAHDAIFAAVQAEVAYRHRSFIMSDDLDDQLSQMARWLTDDSSKFGMILCGGCGNGKSTMVKAFQQLINFMRIPSPNEKFSQWGISIIDAKYVTEIAKSNYKEFRLLANRDMLGVDDLGVEPREILEYGNVITPVIDLLTMRYEEQRFTLITTNLTPLQIRNCYGDRIADRLNEMCEKIVFKNDTYRS